MGNSLVVQWLGLASFTTMARGSIPGQGIKILQAMRHGQKKKSIMNHKFKVAFLNYHVGA